jgi:cytochrome b561
MQARKTHGIWYGIGIIASIALALYGAYGAVFFAWVTATPVSPANLRRAQRDCYIWAAVSLFGLAVATALVIRIIWLAKQRARDPAQSSNVA